MAGHTQDYALAGNVAQGQLQTVGWAASSVGVFNPGSTWVHFPDLGTGPESFVAPFTADAMVPAPLTHRGMIRVSTADVPPGFTVDLSNLQTVQFKAYEDAQPASSGRSMGAPGPQSLLGTVDVLNAGTNTGTFTLPPGTHAVSLLYAQSTSPNPPGGGWVSPTGVLVRGVTTGGVYFNPPSPTSGSYDDFLVDSGADSQITVKLTNANNGTARAWVVALTDPAAVNVSNTPASPVYVASVPGLLAAMIRDSNNAAIVIGQQTMALSLAVVLASNQSAVPIGMPGGAGTWTTTSIAPPAAASTLFTILAANANRRGALVYYITGGGGAISLWTSARFVTIPAGGYWEMPSPVYQSLLQGLTEQAGSSSVTVTEIT